ncbi:MAG TPA: mechanosensitive ion channel domain-containing protein, partial [Ramlibacter sp.]|nr:mechanosensitive ion channel domain-containing protein [Ramlibacter sp.]
MAPPTDVSEARDDARTGVRLRQRLSAVEGLQGVRVHVASGVARLDGEVLDLPTRTLAQTVAERTPGVDAVHNRLQLTAQLGARFAFAREQASGKLLRLLANTPLLVIAAAIVLVAGWFGQWLAARLRLRRLHGRNPYLDGLIRRAVHAGLFLLGLLLALDLLGATPVVGALLGSAGVIGLVAGLAFKDLAENYIAGVLLSLRRPFEPGDHVLIEGREGKVVALTSRATILITLDGNQLQLPNSLVFKSVILNYSRNPKRRFDFLTNVGARCPWHSAMEIGIATLQGLHGVLADPPPSAQIHELADDGVSLRFLAWVDQREADVIKTRSEAMRLVRRALREAGIVPPSPVQRVELSRDAPPPEADDSARQRDVSIDHDVDAQVDAARADAGRDL